jgi:hypothetical protein
MRTPYETAVAIRSGKVPLTEMAEEIQFLAANYLQMVDTVNMLDAAIRELNKKLETLHILSSKDI